MKENSIIYIYISLSFFSLGDGSSCCVRELGNFVHMSRLSEARRPAVLFTPLLLCCSAPQFQTQEKVVYSLLFKSTT